MQLSAASLTQLLQATSYAIYEASLAQLTLLPDIKGGYGPPSAFFVNPETPKPIPSSSECLVRVKAFGLNRGDLIQREGKYPMPPGTPKELGLEFSGVVVAVGHDDKAEERHEWKMGDEVFGLVYGGAYAEYVVVSKKMLLTKPKELSWECCGGLCEVWLTALQALYLVGTYKPETTRSILWHAGTSGVSMAGIQLSLCANLCSPYAPPKVFATTRRNDKRDFCVTRLGCDGAVNTTSFPEDGWASEIKKLNGGKGIDLVVDFVGGPYFQANLDVLALDGRVVFLGLLGGPVVPKTINMAPLLMKRLRLEGSTLRSRSLEYQALLRDMFEEKVLPGLVEGQFQHVIEKVFKWGDVGEAHELLDSNQTKGKIVCVVD